MAGAVRCWSNSSGPTALAPTPPPQGIWGRGMALKKPQGSQSLECSAEGGTSSPDSGPGTATWGGDLFLGLERRDVQGRVAREEGREERVVGERMEGNQQQVRAVSRQKAVPHPLSTGGALPAVSRSAAG